MNDEEIWKLSNTMRIFVENYIDPKRASLDATSIPVTSTPEAKAPEVLATNITSNLVEKLDQLEIKNANIDYVIGNLKKLAFEIDTYNNDKASYLVEMAISALEDIKNEDLE